MMHEHWTDEEREAYARADEEAAAMAHRVTEQDEARRRDRQKRDEQRDQLYKRIGELQRTEEWEKDAQRQREQKIEERKNAVLQKQNTLKNHCEQMESMARNMVSRHDATPVADDPIRAVDTLIEQATAEAQMTVNRNLERLDGIREGLRKAYRKRIDQLDEQQDECRQKMRKL